jgi:hypothetical protein
MIHFDNIDEHMQLRANGDIEKEFPDCFKKNDIITVIKAPFFTKDCSGLIVVCRRGQWHHIEDFVCDDGSIDGFEIVFN